MRRTAFALIVAALAFIAVAGTSQAAPIAPLAAGVTGNTDHDGLTQVYWHRGWGWHRGWHRRCWRGRWGRLHCW